MYNKWFFLNKSVWNNAFSYEKRNNKKLYVPEIIKIDNLYDIKLQQDKGKIAFEDFGFDDKLSTNYGLENFYEINWEWKKIYLFDNHNHAYFFWYLSRKKWIIWDNNTLLHVDEHADTRNNNKHLLKPESSNLEKVFKFTNEILNVGDYIIPAQEEWIIWNIIQIRNETNLKDYENKYIKGKIPIKGYPQGAHLQGNCGYPNNIILNLDLDFFQPDLDFINYNLKKKVILDIAKKASIITVSTSPFFIDQNLAIKVFEDLFWN